MFHRILLAVLIALACSTAQAGDWLGGQYWGQISGCGHCGGSLYGCGGGFVGKGSADFAPQDAPLPPEIALPLYENTGAGVDAIPDPQVPVLRTAYSTRAAGPSSRRGILSRQVNNDILPIAADNNSREVKTITHLSQPERLSPPSPRLVAPNAWSDRLYR